MSTYVHGNEAMQRQVGGSRLKLPMNTDLRRLNARDLACNAARGFPANSDQSRFLLLSGRSSYGSRPA
jgi:hypothetical protein